MGKLGLLLGIAMAASGCTVGEPDTLEDTADGKGDATGVCADKLYGDGTCNLKLSCGQPDIDCFRTFDTDAAARQWSTSIGDTLLADTDPRVARARKIADRAWAAYKAYYVLGDLESKFLSVIVIDNARANAFVSPDENGKALVSVFFHSGILEPTYSDDVLIGVVAHELGHMAKLHTYPEVGDNMERFYTAGTGATEPVGAVQQDHATPRAAVTAWRDVAKHVGADTRVELGGLPLTGTYGTLFLQLLSERIYDTSDTACSTNASRVDELHAAIAKELELDDSIAVNSETQSKVEDLFMLLESCRAKAGTLEQLAERAADLNHQVHILQLPEAERRGNAIDGLKTLTTNARAKLRTLQADYQKANGKPFSSIRFYSYEEQADDIAVRITKSAKLPIVGTAAFFKVILGAQTAACEAAAAKGTAPYGIYLDDPHHGTCWRIQHAQQYASTVRSAPALSIDHPDDVIEHAELPDGHVPTKLAPLQRIY